MALTGIESAPVSLSHRITHHLPSTALNPIAPDSSNPKDPLTTRTLSPTVPLDVITTSTLLLDND